MKITIDIPNYTPESGFIIKWEKDFSIKLQVVDNSVLLEANSSGLISLANLFIGLAQNVIPQGYHIHLDEYNSLENGSDEFIIQKAIELISCGRLPYFGEKEDMRQLGIGRRQLLIPLIINCFIIF